RDAIENYSINNQVDTIISGKTYHKLFTTYNLSFITGFCDGNGVGYKGATRQDINNRKVFFISPADITEQLLYDFNLQVGDTIKGYLNRFTFMPDTIQSIDSILVGTSFRKTWKLPCYNINIIEGIGSTYGLLVQS